MKKTQIILKPKSGLANRMRAIACCIYLKNQFNAEMFVIWEADRGLKATFHEIFETNPNFTLLNAPLKYKLLITHRHIITSKILFVRTISRLLNKITSKIIGVDYCLFDEDMAKGPNHVKKVFELNSVVFLNINSEFMAYPEGIQCIHPKQKIIDKVNKHSFFFNNNTVGIHIRRTDNAHSIQKSPVYLFERKIDEDLSKDKNLKFFIATDDAIVEKYFCEKYPTNILTYPKTYGRDTIDGITDAVVELYLLSRTSRIYGSYWSSYSLVASRISGIKLITLNYEES